MAESIQTLDSWAHMSFPGRQNFTHVTIHCWKNDAHPLWLCWERTLRKLAPAFLQTLPHVPFFSCWFCFVSFWQNKSCTEFYKFLSLIKEPTGGLGYHSRIIILILHSPFDWFSLSTSVSTAGIPILDMVYVSRAAHEYSQSDQIVVSTRSFVISIPGMISSLSLTLFSTYLYPPPNSCSLINIYLEKLIQPLHDCKLYIHGIYYKA